MSTSSRKKISIVFLDEPNFDSLGLKFLLLYLNKEQECFEFEFPEIDEYPIHSEESDGDFSSLIKLDEIRREQNLIGDFFIGILSGEIGKNWFWRCSNNLVVITTKNWKKIFSPPSVFEYLIHCVVSSLAIMMGTKKSEEFGNMPINSHHSTRGCFLDFTKSKDEDRVDIALGYICNDCKIKIEKILGKETLSCFEKMISLEWIGEADAKGSVAYKLKKYFRIDLNKDTGFTKTRKERAWKYLLSVSDKLVLTTLSSTVGIIVGFLLASLIGN